MTIILGTANHQPMRQPKTPRGQRKRQLFLDAARKVFASKGFLDSRVVDIAAEAGASVGNLYQYFADKDQMLAVLLEQFTTELYQASRSRWVGQNPHHTIENATRGMYETYVRNADLFKVMMQVSSIDPKYGEMWMEWRRPFTKRVQRLLERTPEFQRSGVNPAHAASALGSMTSNFAYIWLVLGGDFPDPKPFDVADAVRTISYLWYRSIWGSDPPRG